MRKLCLLFLLAGGLSAFGQTNTVTIDDLMQSAQDWANENLDENVLRALQNTDQAKVRQFFDAVQTNFHGEYVIDLAKIRDTAKAVLPILQQYEETAPYAAWLKAHMDDLEVAEELRVLIEPKRVPGKPPPPLLKPRPEQIREIWIRKISPRPVPAAAKPYVGELKPIFSQQKVPSQLVWVAEVESSFDPSARSPVGAAGLFQLMPDTAKRYGLRTTWPFDQREDPAPSAKAAASYLGYLHEKFKDWRLALAAYNAGEGTVQNLLKRHKATSYDAIASHLPAETQMFVPKVEATIQKREGLKLSELH